MIYILFFLLSIFFAYLAQKSKTTIGAYSSSFVAIMLPAFLAGVRDLGIGTDTWTYVNDVYFDVTKINSIVELINNQLAGNFGEVEMGYVVLNYFTTFLGSDYHWIYFTTNLVFLVTCYWCIFQRRNFLSVAFAWMILLFFYYNLCLNMVRQSIAISFCLAAQCMLEEKKYKLMLLFAFLASISHGTGVMALFSIAILYILPLVVDLFGVKKVLTFAIGFSIILLICSHLFVSYLLNLGIFNDRYSNYLVLAQLQSDGAFQTTYVLAYLSFLYVFYYAYKVVKHKELKNRILIQGLFFYLAFVLFCCSAITYHAFRISLYFMLISTLIYYPEIIKTLFRMKLNMAEFAKKITILVSFFVWWYNIVYKGIHETIPYSSKILDSLF